MDGKRSLAMFHDYSQPGRATLPRGMLARRALLAQAGLSPALALAACTPRRTQDARAPAQPAATVEWFLPGEGIGEEVTRIAEAFQAKHPAITLNLGAGGPNNDQGYRAKLRTMVASGAAPDVFYLEWFVYPPYAVGGHLAELDGLARRDRLPLDDLWPAFARQFRYKGPLWALPWDMQTMVTWYNADLVAQAGLAPPGRGTTWAAFLELAQRLTVRQGSEIERFGTTFWRALHQIPGAFIFMNRGRMFDRDEDPTASTFHEPATIEALEYLASLIHTYRVAPTGPEESNAGGNENGFITGRFAMNMRNAAVRIWQTRMSGYRWASVPLPAGRAGQFSMALSHGLCLSATTAKREAAWTFLRWMGGPEGQAVNTRERQNVPGLRTVAERDYLPEPGLAPVKRVILDTLAQGRFFPNTTRTAEALQIINPTLTQIWNGQLTPRAAGEKLRAEVDAILQRKE